MTDIVERLRRLAEEWFEMCDDIHVPLLEAATEIARLRATVKCVQTAARSLDATRTEIYDSYRKATVINTEAVATLDSEREANAVLTEEIERLRKHAEAMAAHLEWAHEGIERGDLDERMCCDGRMCGCMGASKGDEVMHFGREALAAYRAEYPEEK